MDRAWELSSCHVALWDVAAKLEATAVNKRGHEKFVQWSNNKRGTKTSESRMEFVEGNQAPVFGKDVTDHWF